MANEVRTGLEDAPLTARADVVERLVDPLDSSWMGKPVRQHIKEFGQVFATLFFAIAAYKAYNGRPTETLLVWSTLAVVFGVLGYRAPNLLHPLWKGWMKLAHYLSIVMTLVILSLAWTIGFLPMAFILRVLNIKRIDTSYKTGVATYWESRDPKYDDFKRLENQF